VTVRTFYDDLVSPDARRAAFMVVIAVGLVLVIACANVANLLLARGAHRMREIAVRRAVGAGQARVVRLLLTESLTLALLGGMAGWLLSIGGVAWLRVAFGNNVQGEPVPIHLSGRAGLVALALTGAAGIVVGLLPALRSGVADLTGTLREGGRSETTGVGRGRLRNTLVIGELALSVFLLVAAGLKPQGCVPDFPCRPGFRAERGGHVRDLVVGRGVPGLGSGSRVSGDAGG
jgi:hypothetical protein